MYILHASSRLERCRRSRTVLLPAETCSCPCRCGELYAVPWTCSVWAPQVQNRILEQAVVPLASLREQHQITLTGAGEDGCPHGKPSPTSQLCPTAPQGQAVLCLSPRTWLTAVILLTNLNQDKPFTYKKNISAICLLLGRSHPWLPTRLTPSLQQIKTRAVLGHFPPFPISKTDSQAGDFIFIFFNVKDCNNSNCQKKPFKIGAEKKAVVNLKDYRSLSAICWWTGMVVTFVTCVTNQQHWEIKKKNTLSLGSFSSLKEEENYLCCISCNNWSLM